MERLRAACLLSWSHRLSPDSGRLEFCLKQAGFNRAREDAPASERERRREKEENLKLD